MSLLARLARRIGYLHGVCAFAWLTGVVTSLAVADVESVSAEEVAANFLRLSVLFGVCVLVAYRFRDLLQELHDAFLSTHAHWFILGLLGFVMFVMVGSMLLTRQVRYALYMGPTLIFAQALLAAFCCAGRGFDRMAVLGLGMAFLQGGTGNRHDVYFGGGTLAAIAGGLVFSHFHGLMVRHGSEERHGALEALGVGMACAACVGMGYLALYRAVPRAYGMSTEYVEPTAERTGHGPRLPRHWEESGPVEEGDSSVARFLVNAATGLGGLALAYVLWRAMKRRGKAGTGEGEEEEEAEDLCTVVEDLPAEESEAKREWTVAETPRARVIVAYNRLVDRLKAHGVERKGWETPAEYEEEVGRSGGGRGGEAMRRLTQVFARAKYSLEAVRTEEGEEAEKWAEEVVSEVGSR